MDSSTHIVMYRNDWTSDNYVCDPCLPGAYRASDQLDDNGLVHGLCRLCSKSQNDSTIWNRCHAISAGNSK